MSGPARDLERERTILEALRDGASLREAGALVGVSKQWAHVVKHRAPAADRVAGRR